MNITHAQTIKAKSATFGNILKKRFTQKCKSAENVLTLTPSKMSTSLFLHTCKTCSPIHPLW